MFRIKESITNRARRSLKWRFSNNPTLRYELSMYLYGNKIEEKVNEGVGTFSECFKHRYEEPLNKKEIIERIIKAYRLAKKDQISRPSVYQVSNEWLWIYENHMKAIMDAFASESFEQVESIYKNFMRESCSRGLHGLPADMEQRYFKNDKIEELHKKEYLSDSFYRYGIWKESVGRNKSPERLIMPDLGNAYGYYIDGIFIRTGAEYLHFYSEIISNLLRSNSSEKKTVLEIGAGYEGMAYFLQKNNNNICYIDLDLPENMALTAYFLLGAFPEKQIMLYGEDEIQNVSRYDLAILPNFVLEDIPHKSAHLIFNSYSLAEMSPETIKHYVSYMRKISKEFIYHVNHTIHSTSISSDEFGIDTDGEFILLSKSQARWNLMRNHFSDEYEYLYKRG